MEVIICLRTNNYITLSYKLSMKSILTTNTVRKYALCMWLI